MDSSLGRLLRDRGKVRRLGDCILTYQETGSTNEVAIDWARRGAPQGSLILAESQTAGRGRWQREWSSPRGGLYLTAILKPSGDILPGVSLLPVASSLAATEAIREATGVEAKIRWPNDLLVDGRKVGGILCESSFSGDRPDFLVAGFGINVNQTREDCPLELSSLATSLRLVTGRPHEVYLVAACLAERLEHWWEACSKDPSAIVVRWDELACGQREARVTVRHKEGQEFEAVTSGMADDGGLRVRLADGRVQTLYTEEVVFFRTLDTKM
jgi:BirA family biotin operon repressor/biotin-[acetyl-CoA-carboxylase] ligase